MNLEGIVSGDKMCLRWEIEDLSYASDPFQEAEHQSQ